MFKEELRRNRLMPGRRRLQGKQSGNLQVPEVIKETGTIARAPGSDTVQLHARSKPVAVVVIAAVVLFAI